MIVKNHVYPCCPEHSVRKKFHIRGPENLQGDVEVGKRVFVPFGNKKRTGFIIDIVASCDLKNIKSIIEILDEEPLFPANDLDLYRWTANYFMYPLGKTLAELVPSGAEKKDFFWVTRLQCNPGVISLPRRKNYLLSFNNIRRASRSTASAN